MLAFCNVATKLFFYFYTYDYNKDEIQSKIKQNNRQKMQTFPNMLLIFLPVTICSALLLGYSKCKTRKRRLDKIYLLYKSKKLAEMAE